MKTLLLIVALIFANTTFAQTFTMKTSLSDSTKYTISDSVDIENGHGEKVKVLFNSSILKERWDALVAEYKTTDEKVFEMVAGLLSINAQYSLKNKLSFEPLKTQFIMWFPKSNAFMCNYKMMGRNGYGNLTETSAMVEWKPEKK